VDYAAAALAGAAAVMITHEHADHLDAGAVRRAACTMASCIRDWLDDGPTTRQASTVGNYRPLADHATGKLGAVKLKS
jgi:phosphoribosyl 1,2-cyclic phosphodiesterase